jgi:hypothetical protein
LKQTHTIARRGRPFDDRRPPAAAPVWEVIDGFGRFHTLVAAIDLGVFDSLAHRGPSTASELADELGVSSRHLDALLGGVVATGLLDHRLGRFELTDTARRYLTRDGAATMRELVSVSPGPFANWESLAQTVRTGVPPEPIDDRAADYYGPLVEATFPTIFRCATRAVAMLRLDALDRPATLDVGAGGAPWTAALLSANAGATAVVNELPGVIEVARRRLGERDLLDRVVLEAGDYRSIDLGRDRFDVAVLGHVLRAEGIDAARALVVRTVDALRPGAHIVVGDYFLDRQRAHAGHALAMGVTMIANTRRGEVFSAAECAAWLRDAGCEAVRLIEPIGFQQVLVASKRP